MTRAFPSSVGIQLDDRVEAALLEEVAGDPLDLLGRAAVHRRQRDAVGDAVGISTSANAGTRVAACVADRVEELGAFAIRSRNVCSAGAADAVEGVPHALVEDAAPASVPNPRMRGRTWTSAHA